jgi:gluconate 2-dehydrogenase gamma chain
MDRRRFIGAAAGAAASATAGCGLSKISWRSLTAEEARTLEAVCACLIPADRDPGATQAGVVNYIDRQLQRKFRPHLATYREGLREAARRCGGDFAGAPGERQIAVLQAMETDPQTKAFFNLVAAHAMQGFYGNPRHGGNRDFVSWKMLGVTPTQVRGRNHYEFPAGERR